MSFLYRVENASLIASIAQYEKQLSYCVPAIKAFRDDWNIRSTVLHANQTFFSLQPTREDNERFGDVISQGTSAYGLSHLKSNTKAGRAWKAVVREQNWHQWPHVSLDFLNSLSLIYGHRIYKHNGCYCVSVFYSRNVTKPRGIAGCELTDWEVPEGLWPIDVIVLDWQILQTKFKGD